MYVCSIELNIVFLSPIHAQMRDHLFGKCIKTYSHFPFLTILLKTWFQSSSTHPVYHKTPLKRDHLPQRHINEHSNPAGMSLQVLTENCFIAQKRQEYNKNFGGSLIFLTFTTLPINLICLYKAYLTQRLILNAPSFKSVWELWYIRDHFNTLWQKLSCICWVLQIIKSYQNTYLCLSLSIGSDTQVWHLCSGNAA